MRLQIRKLRTIAIALTFGLGLTFALTAQAVETDSGNVCESIYPPNSPYGTSLYHGSIGVWNNTSEFGPPAARYVYCPLHRENGLSTSGLANVYVDVDDPSGTMRCIAESFDEYSNIIASETVTIPSAGTDRLLTFHSLPSVAWGSYQVFCTMPDRSVVHSLQYTEN